MLEIFDITLPGTNNISLSTRTRQIILFSLFSQVRFYPIQPYKKYQNEKYKYGYHRWRRKLGVKKMQQDSIDNNV